MRFLILVVCTFSFGSFAQNNDIKLLDKLLAQDSSNHSHIIDFRVFGLGSGIGYNYIYSPFSRLNFGARVGTWLGKSGKDIPEGLTRFGISYSAEVYLGCRVYKSTYFESSLGYTNTITWPSASNTAPNGDGPRNGSGWIFVSPRLRIVFYQRAVLRIGASYFQDQKTKKWNLRPCLSIGYKF